MVQRLVGSFFFFFQAEDGIRDYKVTGVQTCALPILCKWTSDWCGMRPASYNPSWSSCRPSLLSMPISQCFRRPTLTCSGSTRVCAITSADWTRRRTLVCCELRLWRGGGPRKEGLLEGVRG